MYSLVLIHCYYLFFSTKLSRLPSGFQLFRVVHNEISGSYGLNEVEIYKIFNTAHSVIDFTGRVVFTIPHLAMYIQMSNKYY